jgi:hypothetical protein
MEKSMTSFVVAEIAGAWEMAIWELYNRRPGRRKEEIEHVTEQRAGWEGRGREGREGGCSRALGAQKKKKKKKIHDDNGEGRRNKGQPGVATPGQTGHLGQKMRDGYKHGVNGVTGPTP